MPGIAGATLLLSALMTSGASPQQAERPIRLVSEEIAGGVRLQVVGASDVPVEASYSLEVSGGGAGGTNRSVQRGTASLRPGQSATLVTLTLKNGQADWSATLEVDPADGAPYEQVASSRPAR